MKITQLGLGVSRSNGVIIQPHENQIGVAFSNEFTSEGLKFTISERILSIIKNRNSDYAKVKFSDQTLKWLGCYILSNKEKFKTVSSFDVESTLDILVEQAKIRQEIDGKFHLGYPKTEKEFFESVFQPGNVPDEELFDRRSSYATVTNDKMNDDVKDSIKSFHQLIMF